MLHPFNTRFIFKKLGFLLVALLAPAAAIATPLSNSDVIALAAAGFSEEIQIAKVKQADEVAFDLSVDGLKALKEAGVLETVIAAMLARDTPDEPPAVIHPMEKRVPPVLPGIHGLAGISVETEEEAVELPLDSGYIDQVGGGLLMPIPRFYFKYPGLTSSLSLSERKPNFIATALTDKQFPLFLVRLKQDRREGEHGARSLKIKRGMSTVYAGPAAGTYRLPDKDWSVDMTVEKLEGRQYRLQPNEPLEPGQYGFYVPVGMPKDGGGLYSFTIE